MPFSEDNDGPPDLYDFELVWAIMGHPRDEAARNHYMARIRERLAATREGDLIGATIEGYEEPLSESDASIAIGMHLGMWLARIGGFRTLSGAPPFAEVMERRKQSTWPGCVAGDVLLHLLSIDKAGYQSSINKAVAATVRYLRGAKTATGQRVGGSERYVRKAWEDFKPSSHLWAAYRVWQFNEGPGIWQGPAEFSPHTPESLAPFLAIAEKIADIATQHVSHGRRAPTVPGDLLWRTPPSVPLPDVTFEIPDKLDPYIQEALDQYRAPRQS